MSTSWYDNGQLHTKEDFVADKRNGELLVYYPDATLRRRDQFVKGQRTAGECFGPDGKPVPYFEYHIRPVYSEGKGENADIVNAIQRRVAYSTQALVKELDARIFIGFTVTDKGEITNLRVVREPAPDQIRPDLRLAFAEIRRSALDAARQLKSFTLGQVDGVNVPIGYVVPITFRTE